MLVNCLQSGAQLRLHYMCLYLHLEYSTLVALESWHDGISTPSVVRPVADEERMNPGHWMGSALLSFL